jgi:phosphinothricin acetyltransferase
MPEVMIGLAGRSDVARALAFANWAAAHTAANFSLLPESLESWQDEYDLRHEMYPWLVARGADGVVGFAKASPHRARGAYAWTAEVTVYIDPEHHHRGIGSALYRVLLPVLRAQGYVTLIAGITSPHEPSERLHAAFGFQRCATFHRMGWKLRRWHDVSYWQLHLVPDGEPAPIRAVGEVWPSLSALVGATVAVLAREDQTITSEPRG